MFLHPCAVQGCVLHLTSRMLDPRTPSLRAVEEQLTYTLEDTWGGHLLVAGEERRVFTQQDVSSGSVLFVETASRAEKGSMAGFDFTASTQDYPAVHEHFSVDVLAARITGAVVEQVRARAWVICRALFGNVRQQMLPISALSLINPVLGYSGWYCFHIIENAIAWDGN